MLHTFLSLREISFAQLSEVYYESNLRRGAELAPWETEERQLDLGEQDFYCYLQDVFFRQPRAIYAVWEENGAYVSALRLESFHDGLLLEALETKPEMRRRGFAERLICSVLQELSARQKLPVYSHVSKRNKESLAVHTRCGFRHFADYAAFIDGSVSAQSLTMIFTDIDSEKLKKGIDK